MTGINRGTGLAMAVLALAWVGPAAAQESLDAGKSGAQLFASDCALCHKSPQGLAKSGGIFGLSGFLKQHYTASQETANIVAKYLESLPNGPAPSKRTGPTKKTAKGDDKAKPGDKKSDDAKPVDAKPVDAKPGDAKSPEKPADSKASEAKPNEPKADPAPAAKPDTKPDKPEKSD